MRIRWDCAVCESWGEFEFGPQAKEPVVDEVYWLLCARLADEHREHGHVGCVSDTIRVHFTFDPPLVVERKQNVGRITGWTV